MLAYETLLEGPFTCLKHRAGMADDRWLEWLDCGFHNASGKCASRYTIEGIFSWMEHCGMLAGIKKVNTGCIFF